MKTLTSDCCDALVLVSTKGCLCHNCSKPCQAVDNTEAEITGDDDHLSTIPEVFAEYINKEITL